MQQDNAGTNPPCQRR